MLKECPKVLTLRSIPIRACLLAATGWSATACAAPLDIVVPAYFYPSFSGSAWDQLTTALSSGVRITAIMNPGSGPGNSVNSDYTRAINNFRAAGGIVLGYVPSGFLGDQVEPTSTCRPAIGNNYVVADIVSCAASYNSFYTIDGIFVDEFGPPATGATDAQVLSFYTNVYDGLKTVNANWSIVGNPGTAANAALLRNGTSGGADRLVTFENASSAFATAPQNPALALVPSQALINIIYDVSDPAVLDGLIAQIAARNVGGIFITDDILPNPYDTLPAYFTTQVAAIARFNAQQVVPEPATLGILTLGLTGLTLAHRRKRQIS
jgi:Spherulation-specific family 4/PEP-CTERM motif